MNRGILEELLSIARDPYPKVRAWKKGGERKIIGSTLADVPEELIHAAGLFPFTILGTNKSILRANTHLPDNACSQARSDLELVLTYQRDFFDGYILPQVDDTTQHLSDIWRRNVSWDYFEHFLLPRQVDRPSARQWLLDETMRLKRSLESFTGKEIPEGRTILNSSSRSCQLSESTSRPRVPFLSIPTRACIPQTSRGLSWDVSSSRGTWEA